MGFYLKIIVNKIIAQKNPIKAENPKVHSIISFFGEGKWQNNLVLVTHIPNPYITEQGNQINTMPKILFIF